MLPWKNKKAKSAVVSLGVSLLNLYRYKPKLQTVLEAYL